MAVAFQRNDMAVIFEAALRLISPDNCSEDDRDYLQFLAEENRREMNEEWRDIQQTERRELAILKQKNRRANRREQKALAQKRAEDICLRHHPFSPIIKEDGWRFTEGIQKFNFMGVELRKRGTVQVHEEKPSKRHWFVDIDQIDGHIYGRPVGVWNARKWISSDTRASRGDDDLGFKSSGRRPRSAARAEIHAAERDMENSDPENGWNIEEGFLKSEDEYLREWILRYYDIDGPNKPAELKVTGKGWCWE